MVHGGRDRRNAGRYHLQATRIDQKRLADWIDLATPFAVLGCATMLLKAVAANAASWTWMFAGGVAFALGHGLHLAANSISNVNDQAVAHASIVHLWDEVASHYIWYSGLYLVLVALWIALRDHPIRIDAVGVALAVFVALTLVNTYIEGGVAWFGLGVLRDRHPCRLDPVEDMSRTARVVDRRSVSSSS